MEKIRWGIVGTGNISNQFVQGLKTLDDVILQAVASRSMDKAQEFADKHDFHTAYGSYSDMLENREIDVVYIGTPHTSHLHDVEMFLDAGFNVLCEKPLGVNASETKRMIGTARRNNVFFMEGMWTRFFPAVQKALEWYRSGKIGRIKIMSAHFGYDGSRNREQWRFKNGDAGGALLDVGIYPLAMAFLFLGSDPSEITGACNLAEGVDEYNAFILKYGADQLAVLSSGISVRINQLASIEGEKGRILIHKFWLASKAELLINGDDANTPNGPSEVFEEPYQATGFQYEAKAVGDCLRKGLKESPVMPLDETLKIAGAMDSLRKMWGLRYPADAGC